LSGAALATEAAVSIRYGSAQLSILFAVAQPAISSVCESAVIIARLTLCNENDHRPGTREKRDA
jgi:hypothetical protein